MFRSILPKDQGGARTQQIFQLESDWFVKVIGFACCRRGLSLVFSVDVRSVFHLCFVCKIVY